MQMALREQTLRADAIKRAAAHEDNKGKSLEQLAEELELWLAAQGVNSYYQALLNHQVAPMLERAMFHVKQAGGYPIQLRTVLGTCGFRPAVVD